MNEEKLVEKPTERSYPAVYEKVIPIAIGVIVILIVGMLALAVAIAAGGLTG